MNVSACLFFRGGGPNGHVRQPRPGELWTFSFLNFDNRAYRYAVAGLAPASLNVPGSRQRYDRLSSSSIPTVALRGRHS